MLLPRGCEAALRFFIARTPKRTKKRRSIGTPRSPSTARKTPPKQQRLYEYSQAELELDLAMAFYATGISFRVLEDPKMKQLFQHLRPDFNFLLATS
ncbi:hypothetical protein L917_17077 [Phytophthora nicotianae]|uniref:Uncharacterized protein n=1 Tax=Phytophthora nicotianae TaxID=4792 RepID=W2KEM2_PHYNI|nr:hypothetical protein L915_17351 [Phytophthora nicotianae]ETL29619.1 hypothetical protein L916_17244 [Phytophthora nicotianae]ETL82840.1 hypothetical protein L917_17077 [Phytophthora nicotianae]ETM36078.1 hypothetical protein L914_17147 [Phytophthora nicotianae]